MKIGDLKKIIQNLPDDMKVFIAAYEGDYIELEKGEVTVTNVYPAPNSWAGTHRAQLTEPVPDQFKDQVEKVFIIKYDE